MTDRLRELRHRYQALKQEYHERRPKMDATEREALSRELDELRRELLAEEEGGRG